MISTRNFNLITDPKLACCCFHPKCDEPVVSQEILDRVQLIRTRLNRSLTINSGGRCKYHPDEIHRTTPADHQKRQALDISVSGGVERAEIVVLAIEYGFNAIGVARNFVHVGYREGEPLVMWVY